MAKALTSPIIGAISGSLAGISFRRSGKSMVLSARRKPGTAPTNRQLQARAELARAHTIWQSLSDPVRESWRQWANTHHQTDALGQQKTLTPFQWFVGWVPYAECAIPQSIIPTYAPSWFPVLSPLPWPASADFTAGGAYNIETDIVLYPAYKQYLRVRASLGSGSPIDSPRIWRSLGFAYMGASQTVDVSGLFAAVNWDLATGQYCYLQIQHLIYYYPPSPWVSLTALTQ